jgi:hypothetical protein
MRALLHLSYVKAQMLNFCELFTVQITDMKSGDRVNLPVAYNWERASAMANALRASTKNPNVDVRIANAG